VSVGNRRGKRSSVARVLRVERFSLRVRDGLGALVQVDDARAELRSGRAGLAAQALMVGGRNGELWELHGVDAAAIREGGKWLFSKFSVRTGRVIAGAAPGIRPLRERLAAALSSVSSTPVGKPRTAPPERDWSSNWSRVAGRAAVWVGDLTVAVQGANGEEELIRGLHGAIVREQGDVVRTWGAGAGLPAGWLRWELEVRPGDLRGEGTIEMQDLPVAWVAPLLPEFALRSAREARIDGELALRGDGLERLGLAGNVRIRGLVFESPRIGPKPVRGVQLALSGRGAFLPARGRLEFESARVAVGDDMAAPGSAVGVGAVGALEWQPDHFLVDVTATLATTPCGAAVGAIPRDLLAETADFRMAGTLAGGLRVLIDSRDLAATRVDVEVSDQCVFEEVPAFADMRRFAAPFIQRALEPDGREFAFETGPGSASWTPLSDMSPFLLHAVIAHEDAGFLGHSGFAPSEIQVALVRNLSAGRYVQGASTITMQLVKNVFLHREKTLARKVQEVLLTWWTESVFSKAQILELYLNVIEYGPAIYGIRAAASHYFGKEPRDLSAAESAFLATVLPSPKLFHAAYLEGSPSPRLRERLRGFLRRMAARERIDAAALEAGLAEVDGMVFYREGAERPPTRPLVGTSRPLPFGVPEDTGAAWSEALGEMQEDAASDIPDEANASGNDGWSSDAE
jgi:hypothetical protein